MADRVELAFRRSAHALIPNEARILLAVSGGSDSIALLQLMRRAAPSFAWELAVAHLDHGLRRGSRTDRRFVAKMAHELSLDFLDDRREVDRLRRRGESPEEAARRVRRDFLLECRERISADWIATGHTLDDQAETVLMRFVRGAGATALSGMAEQGPGRFVRPLLRLERADLRGYLARRGIQHREDPSNRDHRFDRNRVRALLLPLIADTLNPRAARNLVRGADRLRDDALCLDGLARQRSKRIVHRDRAGRLVLDGRALARQPDPIGRRIAGMSLREAGVDARRVTAHHIEGLLDLTRGPRGRELSLPGGHCAIAGQEGRIRLERSDRRR